MLFSLLDLLVVAGELVLALSLELLDASLLGDSEDVPLDSGAASFLAAPLDRA